MSACASTRSGADARRWTTRARSRSTSAITLGHSVVPASATASSDEAERVLRVALLGERPGEGAPPEDLRENVRLSGLVARRGRIGRGLLRPSEVDQRVRELPGERRRERAVARLAQRVIGGSQCLLRSLRVAREQLAAADVLSPRPPQHDPLAQSLGDLPHAVERATCAVDVSGLGEQIGVAAEHERLRGRVVAHALQQLRRPLERLRHRRRPPREVHREHPGEPARERVREPLGKDPEPVDRIPGGARPADGHAREIREPAGADERLRVVVSREQLDGRLRLAMEAIDRGGRRRQLELDLPPAHLGQRAGDLVDAARSVELVEHADGLGVASSFHERLAEVHDDAGARRMPRGQQGRRTSEQPGRGVDVGAPRSPPSGRRETPGGTCAERLCLVVDGAELGAVEVALLEVVPEDLLVLGDPRGDQALQPVGELLVQGLRGASSRSRGRRHPGRGCA